MENTEKYCKNGRWFVMELTKAEADEVRFFHRKECNRIMKECIDDADKLYHDRYPINVAIALFTARMPSLYGMIQNRVQEKIKMEIPEQYTTGSNIMSKEEEKRLRKEKIDNDV